MLHSKYWFTLILNKPKSVWNEILCQVIYWNMPVKRYCVIYNFNRNQVFSAWNPPPHWISTSSQVPNIHSYCTGKPHRHRFYVDWKQISQPIVISWCVPPTCVLRFFQFLYKLSVQLQNQLVAPANRWAEC